VYVYKGRRISVKVYEAVLPNGRRVRTEAVEHPGAVVIIPMLGDGRLVLVRQYRRVIGEWIYEFPAGTLEPGEHPEDCARRELGEETGFTPGKLRHLGTLYTTPGYSTEKLYFYLAENLREGRQHPEPSELIEVEVKNIEEAEEMAAKGEIRDMKTVAGLMLLRLADK